MVHHKISLCTVCMNRTMHLKETLLQNIRDNVAYGNVEFVLLNYGSRDELHNWVQETLQPYIDSGILVYFHTKDPQFFHMSHAKNMAFRLATGDVLCSIDADNYTGAGFAAYINNMFNKDGNIFISPGGIGPGKKWWDVQGRICIKREDFYTLRGYDESVMDYGYEDQDLKSRLAATGRKKMLIKDKDYLHAIRHDDSMRITGGHSAKTVKELFVGHFLNNTSEVICLLEGNTFERFYIYRDLLQYKSTDNDELKPRKRYTGTYEINGNTIRLFRENGAPYLQLVNDNGDELLSAGNRRFYRVTSSSLKESFLLQRAIYLGKKVFFNNKKLNRTINPSGFGQGHVFRNFCEEDVLLSS